MSDRDDRAVSTVVDISLFLLLVGVAVLTLLQAPTATHDPAPDRAHEIATVLASSTAEVESTAEPNESTAEPNESPKRPVHGTRASLLADAAVRNATVDGNTKEPTAIAPDDEFETAVVAEIQPTLAGSNWRAEVVVEWRPYPDAHLDGQFRLGHHPPPDADVSIARTTVGSGVSNATAEARAATANGDGDGYDAVADVAAGAIVEGLFPPERTRAALEDSDRRNRTVDRYRAAGDAYEIDLETPAARGEVEHANRKLREEMAGRMAADLRETFDSPEDAADALQMETVRVTVRTWSP